MKRKSVLSLIISTLFLIISCSHEKPPVIAFYGVDENTRSAMTEYLNNWYGSTPWESTILDDSLSLSDAMKQQKTLTAVVAWYGAGAEQAASKLITPPASMYEGYPTTVRALSDSWMPLLADHEEAAWRLRNLRHRKEGMPRTLKEALEYVADPQGKEMTARWPIAIAGKTDKNISMFLSAYIESTWGSETANTLNALITETEQKALAAAKKEKREGVISVFEEVRNVPLNEQGATLNQVLATLNEWTDAGLMHPEWQKRDRPYVETLMEDGQAELVFMPLSEHRAMRFRVVQNFTESFMPVNRSGETSLERSLVLPALCIGGVHQTKKGADDETLQMLAYMTSRDVISEISIITGLAPLSASAEAADAQASNVRFYAAASSTLLQDMGSAFTSKGERIAFFEEIRQQLH